jgi:Ca2+-binding RTX toxin-like protein
MVKKNLVLWLAIVIGTLSAIGTITPSYNLAWGATKLCNFPGPQVCAGTNSADTMGGDGQDNRIFGCGGDDVISGADGGDTIVGDGIDLSVCPGGGDTGADRIYGGPGNDLIAHGFAVSLGPLLGLTKADGHRDLIDCGPGDDTVFINVSVDNDVAINCEHVNAG